MVLGLGHDIRIFEVFDGVCIFPGIFLIKDQYAYFLIYREMKGIWRNLASFTLEYELSRWLSGKRICHLRQELQETLVGSWVRKIPQRRKWQPTPVFLPGESHGWRSLAGYSPWGCKESHMTQHAYMHHQNIFISISFPPLLL